MECVPSAAGLPHALAQVQLSDLIVLACGFVMMVYGLGNYGLFEPHEGHFAGIGREMLLSGDWVVPHLNGSPYLNKPPLMYWSTGVSQWIFGMNEFAARFPAALYAWLAVVVAWAWARELWGAVAGRVAAAMLASSVGWFMFSHQVMIDALLSTLLFAALYYFWRALRKPESKWRWAVFYITVALALLAKGPIGAAFPAAIALLFIWRRKRWVLLKQAGLWWGVPLMLIPVAVWALVVEHQCRGFLYHIIVNEHILRIADKREPPDYHVSQCGVLGYLLITIIWCAPWSALLPQTVRFAWLNGHGPAADETDQGRRDAILLMALGAALPVLIFLPIPSRLIYYSLPTIAPLSILAAGWWCSEDRRRWSAAAWVFFLVVGAAIFSAGWWVPGVIAELPDIKAAPKLLAIIPSMAWLLGAAFLACGLLRALKFRQAAVLAFFFVVAFAAVRSIEGFVAYQDVRSSRNMVRELDPQLGSDCLWVMEGSFELGASAGTAYYLSPDAQGQTRFVKVMTDDDHRPQPTFGEAPRDYGLTHPELQKLWDGPEPVVFVTDLMRREFESKDERILLPNNAGEPLAQMWGFRRVYANAAARTRLKLP